MKAVHGRSRREPPKDSGPNLPELLGLKKRSRVTTLSTRTEVHIIMDLGHSALHEAHLIGHQVLSQHAFSFGHPEPFAGIFSIVKYKIGKTFSHIW